MNTAPRIFVAGIKLCESCHRQHGRDYRSVMPTNLHGPNDNDRPENSHVVPALLRRFHEAMQRNAPEVVIWGTGTPKREFLHVKVVSPIDCCLPRWIATPKRRRRGWGGYHRRILDDNCQRLP